MKKFEFRFEKILKIKEHKEIQAKQVYAGILQKKIDLEQENIKMQKELWADVQDKAGLTRAGQPIDFNHFYCQDQFSRAISVRTEKNNAQKVDLEKELEKQQLVLKDAMKEKKMFKKLEEKELAQFHKKIIKDEIKKLDETNFKKDELE